MIRSLAFTAACLLLASSVGCNDKDASRSETAGPEPSSSNGSVVHSAPSATAPEAPKEPPTLVMKRMLETEVPGDAAVYVLSGKLLVVSNNRVGLVDGDKVEWKHRVDPGNGGGFGPLRLTSISGEYPDAIDAFTQFENGRAPAPSYQPLTGKGNAVSFAPGGGMGMVNGTAKVGASLVVHGADNFEGQRVVTVRGPRVERYTVPGATQGCQTYGWPLPAVRAYAFGGAKNGMLVAAGYHCLDEKTAALEVWAPNETKPKIIKLGKDLQASYDHVFPAGEDGVWIVPSGKARVLELRNDVVTPLPESAPIGNAFLDEKGSLYIASEEVIQRFDGTSWTTVAKLPWGTTFRTIVRHGEGFFVGNGGGVFELVPGKGTEYTPECTTPFVFLYDVSWKAEPTYTFPTTRKAFETFVDIDKIGLVEINLGGRRLGVTVPDKETADAVIAHVQKTMKEEKPKLLCLEPTITRKIPFSKRP